MLRLFATAPAEDRAAESVVPPVRGFALPIILLSYTIVRLTVPAADVPLVHVLVRTTTVLVGLVLFVLPVSGTVPLVRPIPVRRILRIIIKTADIVVILVLAGKFVPDHSAFAARESNAA